MRDKVIIFLTLLMFLISISYVLYTIEGNQSKSVNEKQDDFYEVCRLLDDGETKEAFILFYNSDSYKLDGNCRTIWNDYILKEFNLGNYDKATELFEYAYFFSDNNEFFAKNELSYVLFTMMCLKDGDYQSAYDYSKSINEDEIPQLKGIKKYALRMSQCFSSEGSLGVPYSYINFDELRNIEKILFDNKIIDKYYFKILENDIKTN